MHGRVLAAQGDLAGAAKELRASFEGLRVINVAEARLSALELSDVLRRRGESASADRASAEAEALASALSIHAGEV